VAFCITVVYCTILLAKTQVKEAIKYCTIDSGIALAVAFVINLAVVGTFAVQVRHTPCIMSF
jgi:Mn2+/Fe2+ NRAMP family transporter